MWKKKWKESRSKLNSKRNWTSLLGNNKYNKRWKKINKPPTINVIYSFVFNFRFSIDTCFATICQSERCTCCIYEETFTYHELALKLGKVKGFSNIKLAPNLIDTICEITFCMSRVSDCPVITIFFICERSFIQLGFSSPYFSMLSRKMKLTNQSD